MEPRREVELVIDKQQLVSALPAYIGDDRTDEVAFEATVIAYKP